MKPLALIDRAFFLKKIPLFATLDLDLLLPIADKLGIAAYQANEHIFGINDEASRMYFIVKGTVEIRDESKLLAILHSEDFFGDESLFNEKPRAYRALSTTETLLLSISRTNLLTIISECPTVAIGFLQAYTQTTPFRSRLSQGKES